ncbi:conserved hypothetical protein [Vibrio chagasii]|nr:conserved hypothetical protein [Vibrio chagasii]
MIKHLTVNSEILINVPADKAILLELGISELEADSVLKEHESKQELIAIRKRRAPLLVEADHLVNLALDSEVEITPFRQYRQQLRDITQTYKTLKDVVWPQKPSLPQASA